MNDDRCGNDNTCVNEARRGNEEVRVSEEACGNERMSVNEKDCGDERTGVPPTYGGNMATATPAREHMSLRALADLYERTLTVRNQCANRLRAVEQGSDSTPGAPDAANYPLLDALNKALDVARVQMENSLAIHPVVEWLMGVPGINRTVGCRIIGAIPMDGPQCLKCGGDLTKHHGAFTLCDKCHVVLDEPKKKCPTCDWLTRASSWIRTCDICGTPGSDFPRFSELRVFAGLCPGKNKLVKGQRAGYNQRLKTSGYIAFGSMLKVEPVTSGKDWAPKRFYAEIYRKWRNIYLTRYGGGPVKKKVGGVDKEGNTFTAPTVVAQEWPDLRQHLAAKNKLLDVFMVHLWRKWREACGWSVASLYVHEVLGHHMDYDAADFSSEAMAKRKMKVRG